MMGSDVILNDILPKISDNSIVGISAWTQNYPFLDNIAAAIHDKYPNTYIIGGGPHFTIHNDTKNEFLKSNLDAYAVGGSAFIECCDNLNKNKIQLNGGELSGDIPKGFYYRSDNHVVGSGVGGFPKIDLIPKNFLPHNAILEGKYVFIPLPSSNKCYNNCNYCISPKNDMDVGFLESYVLSILKNPKLHGSNFVIEFDGNNPFMGRKNRIDTEYLMSKIINSGENIEAFRFFLDPYLFTGNNYAYIRDTVMNNEQKFDFFVGVDVVQKNNARKLWGNPRTQQQLDMEFEGLANFMTDVDKKNKKTSISLSHIFFPEDNLDIYKQVVSEMIYLTVMEEKLKNIELNFHMNILTPFPGTAIRTKYKDRLDETMPWGLYSIGTNVWKDAPLLDDLEMSIRLYNKLNKHNLFDKLERHAADIARIYYPYIRSLEPTELKEISIKKDVSDFIIIAKYISEKIQEQLNNQDLFSKKTHMKNVEKLYLFS